MAFDTERLIETVLQRLGIQIDMLGDLATVDGNARQAGLRQTAGASGSPTG